MSLRAAAAAALVVFGPSVARAQFAGVVTAPPRREKAVPLTASQSRAQRDSIRHEVLRDMRAWVDSAAGVVIVTPKAPDAPGRDPASRADTTRKAPPPPEPARPPAQRPPGRIG